MGRVELKVVVSEVETKNEKVETRNYLTHFLTT